MQERGQQLRTLVLAACMAGTVAVLTVGAARLDARFHATRFVSASAVRGCPLGVVGDVVTPLCAPTRGW